MRLRRACVNRAIQNEETSRVLLLQRNKLCSERIATSTQTNRSKAKHTTTKQTKNKKINQKSKQKQQKSQIKSPEQHTHTHTHTHARTNPHFSHHPHAYPSTLWSLTASFNSSTSRKLIYCETNDISEMHELACALTRGAGT